MVGIINVLQHTTELALHMCQAYVDKDGAAVDATCGNGNDTLWLAKRCKKVYAFDIQDNAIEATAKLLQTEGQSNVVLIKDSHENMREYVKEKPCIIVFNLGFLPGGDKGITTNREGSMRAIESALEILAVGGVLCVTMYPGHPEGALEQARILEWAKALDSRKYHAVFANMLNQSERAPQVIWITKKK